jgi:hypothetical protein
MEKIKGIIGSEVKHHLHLPLGLAFLVSLMTYIIFGIKNLTWMIQVQIIERFLPLMGLMLLSSFFQAEHSGAIRHLLYTKKNKASEIYWIRLIIRALTLGLICLVYVSLIKNDLSEKTSLTMTLHAFSIGFLLGSLGMLTYSLFNNEIAAYALPITVYAFQWFAKGQDLKHFYLFPWSAFQDGHTCLYLLAGLIFSGLAIGLSKRRHFLS